MSLPSSAMAGEEYESSRLPNAILSKKAEEGGDAMVWDRSLLSLRYEMLGEGDVDEGGRSARCE